MSKSNSTNGDKWGLKYTFHLWLLSTGTDLDLTVETKNQSLGIGHLYRNLARAVVERNKNLTERVVYASYELFPDSHSESDLCSCILDLLTGVFELSVQDAINTEMKKVLGYIDKVRNYQRESGKLVYDALFTREDDQTEPQVRQKELAADAAPANPHQATGDESDYVNASNLLQPPLDDLVKMNRFLESNKDKIKQKRPSRNRRLVHVGDFMKAVIEHKKHEGKLSDDQLEKIAEDAERIRLEQLAKKMRNGSV